MNKAKALLDSLMGTCRDKALNERSGEEFRHDNVCKHYLVGYCPDSILGKKLAACRQEFDRPSIVSPGCTKLHSVAMRTEFQQHKEFEKFQREYEGSLLNYLENIVREADSKAAYEKKKHDDMGLKLEFHERLCSGCGMKYKLDRKDGMLGAGEGPELYKEDNHAESELHQLFVKLRGRCEEMKKAARTRPEHGKELDVDRKARGHRATSRSRGRERKRRSASASRKEAPKDKHRSTRASSGSKERDRNKKAKREEAPPRRRSKSKSRPKRSRSRSKGGKQKRQRSRSRSKNK